MPDGLKADCPFEHDGVLVELRALDGLGPASGGAHAGYAGLLLAGAGTAGELLDVFRRLPRRLNANGRVDQFGHSVQPTGCAFHWHERQPMSERTPAGTKCAACLDVVGPRP